MKPALITTEQARVLRAKRMLRHLWEQSGMNQKDVLQALAERGLPLKKTTLSMWLNATGNYVRPKGEYLRPLLEILVPQLPETQRQELQDELEALLGYGPVPESSEMLRNRLSEQLDQAMTQTLSRQESLLRGHLDALDQLLSTLESRLYEYDKGAPVVRVQAEDKALVKELLGIDSLQQARAYRLSSGGYEIPLTRVQSLDRILEVANGMNEGVRVLRAFVERHLLQEGILDLDAYPRVEDFVSYAWEIADRLLHHNRLCRSVPALRRTLLRLMATCWGIRYILRSQEGPVSAVEFMNILQRKGMENIAEVSCAVAVFMGLLARQMLKLYHGSQVQKGLFLAKQAQEMLQTHIPALPAEQETFFYKKELANLCYDTASLLLWQLARQPEYQVEFQALMQQAQQNYAEVLSTVNLFQLGLTEARANHLRCFYLISLCWIEKDIKTCLCEINKLSPGLQLNESYWTSQVARAVAWCVLSYRAKQPADKQLYREAAVRCIHQAALVPGMEAALRQELREDFVLHQVLGPDLFEGSSNLSPVYA